MRRLFHQANSLIQGEGLGSSLLLALVPELKDLLGAQVAFICQLCPLRKSVTPNIIFKKSSEKPWLETWWSLLLGFMHCLSLLPDDSLHLHILWDNTADARGSFMPLCLLG